MPKKTLVFMLMAVALGACGQASDSTAQTAASQADAPTFEKTSHSVNPQYTLFGLRHLVMNNRTYAKKYARRFPEPWQSGEAHFSLAEKAFQTDQADTADKEFRAAMAQYRIILKAAHS